MKIKFKDLNPGERFEVPSSHYWFVKINENNVFSNDLDVIDVKDSFNSPVINRITCENVVQNFSYWDDDTKPAIFEIKISPDLEVEKIQPIFKQKVLDCILKLLPTNVVDLI